MHKATNGTSRSARRQHNAQIRNADERAIHNVMSRLQRSAMDLFWQEDPHFVLPAWKALVQIPQGTFDSLAARGYIELKPRLRGFQCTLFGWKIRDEWFAGLPEKKRASQKFGSYLRREYQQYLDFKFDVSEGELMRKPMSKVTEIRSRSAAA